MADIKAKINAEHIKRYDEIQELMSRAGKITDDEFIATCKLIRDEYLCRWAIGSLNGESRNMGAYSDFVDRAMKAMESHYRVIETQARTRALQEPMREYITIDKETRDETRKRMLKLVQQ